MVLGAGLNLSAAYNNAVKYDYQALPFFSLIAASIVTKCFSRLKSTEIGAKKKIISWFAIIGAVLLAGTIFVNMISAYLLSRSGYLIFKMQMNQEVGYSLFNYTPISQLNALMTIQYLGYAVLISALLWVSKSRIRDFLSAQFSWRPPEFN